jgi:hypothetical protein
MPANAFSKLLRKISTGEKRRKTAKLCAPRKLQLDSLESRDMFSVSSLWFSGDMLVVKTDNAATDVKVSSVGSNVRITELGSNKTWDYAASKVGKVEFQGGAGNDKFVNYIANLPIRAYGNGGNDYLEGYNGADTFVGGAGNDTLIGYGGNDMMWGGDGDDRIMGGDGNDQLMGDNGNDNLVGQAGVDKHWGGAGNDVIVSIDAAYNEYVEGGAGTDTLWIDRSGSSRDSLAGSISGDMVQEVTSFANGADRTLNGDRISDPKLLKSSDSYRTFANNPLFGSAGPKMTDIRQGDVGDCYALAGLGAIARDNPQAIRHNVADFGDGTYGVRLGNSFYRVDNDLPVNAVNGANPAYAKLGAENSMWVAVVEKAFAHYRTGANSYESLNGGWSIEMNRAFRSAAPGEKAINGYTNATALANEIATRVAGGQAVTIGFVGALKGTVPLVAGHMYTIASVQKNSAGQVVSITLRNPWGVDGAGNDGNTSDGLVTLTPAQLYAQTGRVNWGRV